MRYFLIRFLMLALPSALASLPATAACPPLPYTLTNGQVADATQVMADFNTLKDCLAAGPGGANNAVQFNDGSGAFGGVGPLENGQLVIGTTGSAPQATGLTAGPGITITNGPGSITVSAANATTAFQREFGPFAPPSATSFTYIDTPSSVTPTVTNVANVGMVYSVPVTSSTSVWPGAYRAVPTLPAWTLTLRAKYSAPMGNYPEFGIFIVDSSGKMLGNIIETRGGYPYLTAKRLNSNSSLNANSYQQPVGVTPDWFRVSFDGTNINFYASWDGQNWIYYWSETSTTFLNGTLQRVGIGGLSGISNTAYWKVGSSIGAVVTYWDINDDPAAGRTIQ